MAIIPRRIFHVIPSGINQSFMRPLSPERNTPTSGLPPFYSSDATKCASTIGDNYNMHYALPPESILLDAKNLLLRETLPISCIVGS